MSLSVDLQPDQQPEQWNHHVAAYEVVFEPLSNAFAQCALDLLALRTGARLIDIGAGSGGATLLAAGRGAEVLAVDASARMVERVRERARSMAASRIEAETMDGMALAVPECSFDAAVSIFGVILFPDPPRGLREIARVLKPGGRAAIVTWTESERYELVSRLAAAIAQVRGQQPVPPAIPAQLRFRDPAAFR
jgi:ubiquinone/menaquinone biosynthesis C-methylase UbiE